MNFSKRLKETLKWKEMSQTKFAKLLGIEKSNITNWIKGKSAPNLELFYRICLILNESADYLLGIDN